MSDYLLKKIAEQHGEVTAARVEKWRQLVDDSADMTEQQKLEEANNFLNNARFTSDMEQWQQRDYWATPLEFLIKDAGDCEDFSIAKYFLLKAMGVDLDKLRISYVKALSLNQAHMVLSFYPSPGAIPLILDNLNKRIIPADQRQDLQPVYSFNADKLWLAHSRNLSVKAGRGSQLGPWADLNERMKHELPTNH
ncbi:MAG: transglutaminase-like cysteine peptidase [Gammaproteobacteria bacterium]|nr:transglutaminase-like cysteine peptidase [Gammaproteobacteria bacterium]MBQ0838838.1 transglutaminase-like cysteine peptidase [Gammaproteobacteria bacterium]